MAISLSKMKPTEVVRLMNSTDYGTVLSSTQIFRHFDQGGYRISCREDSRCLNFYAYLAWLVDRHNAPPEVPQGYDVARADAARRSAERSLEGRDIGELPAVEDEGRKERCRLDFRLFCETYFPEVCYPISCLEGIANRCAGQLYKGERTRITWTANEIVLPTIRGADSSGVLVRVADITGRIRGMKYKKPGDGRTIRPEFVVIDDPQTSESAGSLEQTRKRIRVLAGDILGLAGPGRKLSGIMPCTVIRPGDMAEQILDKSKHPEWNGERCRMLYQMPSNEELWAKYADLRADELRERGTFAKATEFYRRHREEMDAGAVVSWPARFNYDELSAVQHAMDLKLTATRRRSGRSTRTTRCRRTWGRRSSSPWTGSSGG